MSAEQERDDNEIGKKSSKRNGIYILPDPVFQCKTLRKPMSSMKKEVYPKRIKQIESKERVNSLQYSKLRLERFRRHIIMENRRIIAL